MPVSVKHPLAQFELDVWELNSLFLLSFINLLSDYRSVFYANKLLNQSVIPHFHLENYNRDCKEQRLWMRVKKMIDFIAELCKIIIHLIIFVVTNISIISSVETLK